MRTVAGLNRVQDNSGSLLRGDLDLLPEGLILQDAKETDDGTDAKQKSASFKLGTQYVYASLILACLTLLENPACLRYLQASVPCAAAKSMSAYDIAELPPNAIQEDSERRGAGGRLFQLVVLRGRHL